MLHLLEIAICSDKMQLANVCAEQPSLPVNVSNSSLPSVSCYTPTSLVYSIIDNRGNFMPSTIYDKHPLEYPGSLPCTMLLIIKTFAYSYEQFMVVIF